MMKKRIDFEAHYYTPEVLNAFAKRSVYPTFDPEKNVLRLSDDFSASNPVKLKGLVKTDEERIVDMDANGTSKQILSISQGIELLGTDEAIEISQIVNNRVSDWMKRFPGRFSGFAALPVQDIDAALNELNRCMKELQFFGWNTFSNFGATALDDDRYFPLLERAEVLGAPIYIHPAPPFEGRLTGMGPLLAGGGAGFGIDTAITLLRLILKGVFDRLPNLKVIVGHLGEGLPFTMDRLQSRSTRPGIAPAIKESAAFYFSRNIWVTSSGVYSNPSFRCARDVLGMERILFGSDYPYEMPEDVDRFMSSALEYTEEEKDQLFYKNAEQFFAL